MLLSAIPRLPTLSFKALSRMSSFPTTWCRSPGSSWSSFKALSRMSSFPTGTPTMRVAPTASFQSAVAHELISNSPPSRSSATRSACFKALSRMSSFPTLPESDLLSAQRSFKALSRMSSFPTSYAHWDSCSYYGFKALSRMSSFPTSGVMPCSERGCSFQSAVAHELISNLCV